jgi:hypothetical protein
MGTQMPLGSPLFCFCPIFVGRTKTCNSLVKGGQLEGETTTKKKEFNFKTNQF